MKVVINACYGGFGLSGKAIEWMKERGRSEGDRVERSDPLLVAAVEALGVEAGGEYSALKVVEIPDGVKFIIVEYDGYEHVAEEHRTWC